MWVKCGIVLVCFRYLLCFGKMYVVFVMLFGMLCFITIVNGCLYHSTVMILHRV